MKVCDCCYDWETDMVIDDREAWEIEEVEMHKEEEKIWARAKAEGLTFNQAKEVMDEERTKELVDAYEKEIAEIMRKENVSRERAEDIYIPF
jgi:hypothetical protein